jgi:hypothetical protein
MHDPAKNPGYFSIPVPIPFDIDSILDSWI